MHFITTTSSALNDSWGRGKGGSILSKRGVKVEQEQEKLKRRVKIIVFVSFITVSLYQWTHSCKKEPVKWKLSKRQTIHHTSRVHLRLFFSSHNDVLLLHPPVASDDGSLKRRIDDMEDEWLHGTCVREEVVES